MRVGYNEMCAAHDPGQAHPDSAHRLTVVRTALEDRPDVRWVEPAPATRAAIERVHDCEYIDELEAFCANGGGPWDPDTIASAETFTASLASAGLAEWAARTGRETVPGPETPFALCRPPGHHAIYDDAMGFCFFNNVAVASQSLLHTGEADRILIFDWDVHHANGTEEYTKRHSGAYLISFHQGGLYPGTGRFGPNDHERVLNVPLPGDLDDAGYLRAFEDIVPDAAGAIDPDLILISCGFDGHLRDPIANQRMSEDGYALLADGVLNLARELDAGLGFVLEGGYALNVLGPSVTAIADALSGDVPGRPELAKAMGLSTILERVREHPLLAPA